MEFNKKFDAPLYQSAANLIVMEIINIRSYFDDLIQNVEQGISCVNIFEHGNIFLKLEGWAHFAGSFKGIPKHDPLQAEKLILITS